MGYNYRLGIPVDMEVLYFVTDMSGTPERLRPLTILCCLEEVVVVVGYCIRIPPSTFTQHAGPTIGIRIHPGDVDCAASIIVGAPPLHILVWVVVRQRHVDSVLAGLILQFLFTDKHRTRTDSCKGRKKNSNIKKI